MLFRSLRARSVAERLFERSKCTNEMLNGVVKAIDGSFVRVSKGSAYITLMHNGHNFTLDSNGVADLRWFLDARPACSCWLCSKEYGDIK